MTLVKRTTKIQLPDGVSEVVYYLGDNVVSVILQKAWTTLDCDLIRMNLQQTHPNMPVVFGKELGRK